MRRDNLKEPQKKFAFANINCHESPKLCISFSYSEHASHMNQNMLQNVHKTTEGHTWFDSRSKCDPSPVPFSFVCCGLFIVMWITTVMSLQSKDHSKHTKSNQQSLNLLPGFFMRNGISYFSSGISSYKSETNDRE